MILGVGCDIIRVARVARAAEKEHFLTRVYTPAERAYAMQRGAGCAASLAARRGCAAVRSTMWRFCLMRSVRPRCIFTDSSRRVRRRWA